jgi:hypothetical protein
MFAALGDVLCVGYTAGQWKLAAVACRHSIGWCHNFRAPCSVVLSLLVLLASALHQQALQLMLPSLLLLQVYGATLCTMGDASHI